MLTKNEIQKVLNNVLAEMPADLREGLKVEFDLHQPLHGTIDVVFSKGKECLAMGKFQDVREHTNRTEREQDFMGRFKMAMGYFTEPWYLFGFDGEKLVINDLSNHDYKDEFPNSLQMGIRRLLMLPEKWKAEQKTIDDMLRYIEAIKDMIDEEGFNNNVK